jgi:hypothetical protein
MFGKLLETVVDVATLPVAVAADVVTMGGAMTDKREPYTVTKVSRIGKNVGKVVKTLAE